MRVLRGFENAKAFAEKEVLPVGGYIVKILNVETLEYTWGEVLNISFDIAEGEQKDFYKRDFANQMQEVKKWKGNYRLNVPKDDGTEKDGWTMSKFKSAIVAIEESNGGYKWTWDEQTLKGKFVGALFHKSEWEYNGSTGFYTACHSLRSADFIRSGDFTIPADKLIKRDVPKGFTDVTDADMDSDIPF